MEGLETYFDDYNEWARKILCQCREQMPEVEWRVKGFSIMMEVDWGDGPPMFYVYAFQGNRLRRIDLSAEFLRDDWDNAIESIMDMGCRMIEMPARKEE